MTFIAGFFLGALVTVGTALIFAADKNILDEDDKTNYN